MKIMKKNFKTVCACEGKFQQNLSRNDPGSVYFY